MGIIRLNQATVLSLHSTIELVDTIIFVGETESCGNEKFFSDVFEKFKVIERLDLPRFACLHDHFKVFKRVAS